MFYFRPWRLCSDLEGENTRVPGVQVIIDQKICAVVGTIPVRFKMFVQWKFKTFNTLLTFLPQKKTIRSDRRDSKAPLLIAFTITGISYVRIMHELHIIKRKRLNTWFEILSFWRRCSNWLILLSSGSLLWRCSRRALFVFRCTIIQQVFKLTHFLLYSGSQSRRCYLTLLCSLSRQCSN